MQATSIQAIKNKQLSIQNENMKKNIFNQWSQRIVSNDSSALKSISFYHVGKNISPSRALKNCFYPEAGMTVAILETEDGTKYHKSTICYSTETGFSRRLGVNYVLKSILKTGVARVEETFPLSDFTPRSTTVVSENEFIVKALGLLFTRNNHSVDSKKAYTAKKQSNKQLEESFFSVVNKLKKDGQNTLDHQFCHLRLVRDLSGNAMLVTTSSWNTWTQGTPKEQFTLSALGGATVLVVTLTDVDTKAKVAICSLAYCSSKDSFSRSEGRLQALRHLLKHKAFKIDLQENEDAFQAVLKYISDGSDCCPIISG
jgi:hypothetical protein